MWILCYAMDMVHRKWWIEGWLDSCMFLIIDLLVNVIRRHYFLPDAMSFTNKFIYTCAVVF